MMRFFIAPFLGLAIALSLFVLDHSLSFNEILHLLIAHRFGKLLIDFIELLQQINRFLDSLLNNFLYCPVWVEFRFLLQVIDRKARGDDGLSINLGVNTCQNSQQGAFARAIESDYPDFCPIEIGKRNIF